VNKRIRCIPALGAVFFAAAALTLSACGGIPGNAVVQVDGKPITKSTFEHWLGIAAASSATSATAAKPVLPVPPHYTACIAHLQATQAKPVKGQTPLTPAQQKAQCEYQYKSLQTEVLGFLISSSWVIGEASHLGVKLSDAEVQKEFQKIKNQQFPKPAEFQKFLASSGQTASDLLLRVKLNLLSAKIQQKIVKQKTTVTKAQAEKYYNEHKSNYGTPEKRAVQIILTKTEAEAKKAKQEIESGKSFASVAKAVSIDPASKAKGGLLVGVSKGQEEKALDTALFSAKPGVLSGPVHTPFGYYIYEVKSSTPGTQQTFAQVEASIKQQLTSTGQQTALTKFVAEFKKKWTNKTECRSEFNVMDCKGYKAPKGATGATAAPPTETPATGAT
jgi:foldase protein PrsA